MSGSFPPLPSYLPPDLPPLPPLPSELARLVRAEQAAAKAQGEKPARAGSELRKRLEATGPVRAKAAAANPVAAPQGVWMVAVDDGGTEVWWAVRPLGSGRVEIWDGRTEPVVHRVTGVRPRPVRRSRLQVEFGGGPPRSFRLDRTRGALSDVGLSAQRWWAGGGDDPLTAVVLAFAALGVLVTFPWRIARARARAANRDALAAALRS